MKARLLRGGAIIGAVVLLSHFAQGQSFEVAAIRPSAHPDSYINFENKGGRIRATAFPLRLLMVMAFGIRDAQISGGPSWTNTERFDINAKADRVLDRIPEDQLRPMLQSLLDDRFQLKFHREAKVSSVYNLLVGKAGPKFPPSQAESKGSRELKGRSHVQFTLRKAPMEWLARKLTAALGRPVIDRTELQGEYDMTLEWAPDDAPPGDDRKYPSLMAAVQEQLGLRLEPSKTAIEILVIDHIERPTSN